MGFGACFIIGLVTFCGTADVTVTAFLSGFGFGFSLDVDLLFVIGFFKLFTGVVAAACNQNGFVTGFEILFPATADFPVTGVERVAFGLSVDDGFDFRGSAIVGFGFSAGCSSGMSSSC